VATKISDTEMTSDLTRHTARMWPAPADACGVSLWSVSWLPGRLLTQNQAVTAMTIAEAVTEHADDLADNGSRWWVFIDQWAAELAITGPHAVAEASLSPEDREAEAAEDDGDGVWAAPADGRGNGLLDLTHPERSDLIKVMTPDEIKVILAHVAGYAPEVFDQALADRSETFPDELFGRIEERDQAEYEAEPEGYCTVCDENVSWFLGYEGPQHFRGPRKLVTGSERRELFDAGHEPMIAWREAGAR